MKDVPPKSILRIVTCGSVDDGKSTVIGRLLFETSGIPLDTLSKLRAESRGRATGPEGLDFSLLLDGLVDEREQGITIDVAYRYFDTERHRLIVADVPGHEQYTRNMLTGASNADAAMLLIDVRQGLKRQTKRHLYFVSLFGIPRIIVVINKMDLVDFSRQVFDERVAEVSLYASQIGLNDIIFIPVSATQGHTIARHSEQLAWYAGPTLMEAIDRIAPAEEAGLFRMPVQCTIRAAPDFRGYGGMISEGVAHVGAKVGIFPGNQHTTIVGISTPQGDQPLAGSGQSIVAVLADQFDISRGDVLANSDAPPAVTDQFAATVIWMDNEPLFRGRSYRMRLGSMTCTVTITKIKMVFDAEGLTERQAEQIQMNESGEVTIATDRLIAVDPYRTCRETGAFILIDRSTRRTAGAGLVKFALRRGQNVKWQAYETGLPERIHLLRQRPVIVWLTGLSGAGKSTIANWVQRSLMQQGRHVFVLDGDNVRHGLNRDLGFTDVDRVENVRRTAEVARLMAEAGLIVLVALISPFRRERLMAREIAGDVAFIEVHVDAPMEVCEARDPKGLYAKARSGAILNFTGVNSVYEIPQSPDLVLRTDGLSPEDASRPLMDAITETIQVSDEAS